MIPSGDVDLEDTPAWIGVGCPAVSLGGPLLGDAFRAGSLDALAGRAATALERVRSVRAAA